MNRPRSFLRFLAYCFGGFLSLFADSLGGLLRFFANCFSGFLGFFARGLESVLDRLSRFFSLRALRLLLPLPAQARQARWPRSK
jgi:hypothetical protein